MLIGNKLEYIIIHHSLTKDGKTVSWQAIRNWHLGLIDDPNCPYKNNPMRDIGYHYGCELVGEGQYEHYETLVGRPLYMEGGHCRGLGMNSRSMGICMVGNFDEAPPPRDQLLCIVKGVIVPAILFHSIPLTRILFHREATGDRTCPGSKFTKSMLIQVVQEVLA